MAIGSWRERGQSQQRAQPRQPPAGSPILNGFTADQAAKLDKTNALLVEAKKVIEDGGSWVTNTPTANSWAGILSTANAYQKARAAFGQSVKVAE